MVWILQCAGATEPAAARGLAIRRHPESGQSVLSGEQSVEEAEQEAGQITGESLPPGQVPGQWPV